MIYFQILLSFMKDSNDKPVNNTLTGLFFFSLVDNGRLKGVNDDVGVGTHSSSGYPGDISLNYVIETESNY
jgi:hypothetical protein